MSLDIGEAFSDGTSRTFAKNGLLLAAAFAVVTLLFGVFAQTLSVGLLEAMLESFQGLSPEELNVSQQEYETLISDLRTQLEMARESSPLALGLPAGVAAGALIALSLVSEAVSIVAVRTFAAADSEAVTSDSLTDNILIATLNGFVGSIVVWGLIIVGSVFLLLPGIFFAVVFLFMRQRIAIENENFVEAMAESWRLTKGHRIEVFALGLLVVVVSLVDELVGSVLSLVSPIASAVVTAAVGGVILAFGAAVVTRGYVQLEADETVADSEDDDPYNAALGPDDIPE
ncbi:hypothetical protein KY092_16655 [Natronomonas gomsonensis]|uniref:hypothetical protein n=1 Tax=Natronomonas gomsonensis TaxID=1046043 RepID=UPI0020CA59C8|nr:hypothetical protein [Natronomonas gomsonensis]MCY4732186.1 hypothetical protein [Natronomonas gomsonensis]